MNLSTAQIRNIAKQREKNARKPKYGNNKVIINGEKVADSKHEYRRLNELKLLERAGKIRELQTQVRYGLIPPQVICGEKVRGVYYVADFTYINQDGALVCEDAKGHRTPDYIIKRKLMKLIHNVDVVEV